MKLCEQTNKGRSLITLTATELDLITTALFEYSEMAACRLFKSKIKRLSENICSESSKEIQQITEKKLSDILNKKDHCGKCGCNEWLCGHNRRE